jgi:beta-carotene 15,15'-dioxygenase
MTTIQKPVFLFQTLLSILVIVVSIMEAFYYVEILAIAGLCLAGIPHGAMDALHRKYTPVKNLLAFLGVYILLMAIYGAIWWFFPILALIIFMITSIHHFGQTTIENMRFDNLLSLLWGSLFLLLPISFHQEEAFNIFSGMINHQLPVYQPTYLYVISGFVFLLFMGLVWFKSGPELKLRMVLKWILIFGIFYYTPLIPGFLLAFVIWHAIPSMKQQWMVYRIIEQKPPIIFLLTMILYTAAAALSLFLWSLYYEVTAEVLFILLSIITLPHALVIHRMMPGHNMALKNLE